jgi:hypothetical protein
MDRFWVILLWIILLSFVIGALRYGQQTLQILQSFFGFIFGESSILAGLNPQTGNLPKASQ